MKIKFKIDKKEKVVDVNILDLLKIYIVVGMVASVIFLIFWIIIILLFGPFFPSI